MVPPNHEAHAAIVAVPEAQNNDLAPRLRTAPDLLLHLGLCIAVSSSREVSRVTLPSSAPAGTGLSTNLIQIANEGSNAFLGAYKDLLSISTASEELCRENGRLDQLAMLIVNGATKSSKNMVYQWVMDCVSAYINELNLDMTERYRVAATHSTNVNDQKVSSAMEEVAFAVEQHEAQRQIYDKRTNAHESKVSEQLNEYMFNPFIAAIKRPFKFASGRRAVDDAAELRLEAQRDLHGALRELTKRRKEEMELRLQAKRILAEIADYEHKEMKLNHIGTTIGEVCILLVALGNDVRTLLATFATIGKEIQRIVMTRKDLEEPGGINLGFIKINPFKKKGTLKEPNKKDRELVNLIFLDRIRQMKQVCLGIHVSANLYASIINDVINYGFSEAIRFSYDNLGESSPSKIIAERKKAMARWHQEAGRICSEKNREAKRALEFGLQSMSPSPGRMPSPGFMPSAPAADQPHPHGTAYQSYHAQGYAPQADPPPHGYPGHAYPGQSYPPEGPNVGNNGGVFVMSPSGERREAFEI